MPSPFPGMDPYLEQHWGDVHTRLITYASDQLQKVLPNDLRARVEESVLISGLGRHRSIYPDVRIIEKERGTAKPHRPVSAAVAVAEPLVVELADEPETQRHVEIRDRRSRLITVVEVLSPSNKKPGDAQELYLRKQIELLQSDVSLVEIDLLREGDWIVAVPIDKIASPMRTPYRAVVRRAWQRSQEEYYPISLRQDLPVIKVPLRARDKDVPLALQTLIEQCYENAGYDDIDYNADPAPPLAKTDARWAAELLRRAGRRSSPRRKR